MSSHWGFHKLASNQENIQLRKPINPPISQSVMRFTSPQRATVSSSTLTYESNNLLGIPLEVRQHIWQQITSRDDHDRRKWFARPTCEMMGLLLCCRQVYHELEKLWRRFDVPWNRLRKLFSDTPKLNMVNIKQFRALSFEIRHDAHPGYFTALTDLLHKSQPYLKELRLFFIGPDRYGTRTFLHGCGNLEEETSETRLPIDGQEFGKFLCLWQRIMLLRRLEILVISNANLQIYQTMVLENKPYLEYLHLSADSRSTIHQQHHISDLGRLIDQPKLDEYPPVRALCIHANATISSVQIASKLGTTLEHLTWVVPDPSLSSGGMRIPWYDHTAILLEGLHLRAPNLQTLRICIGGAGLYEGHHEYGRMMGSVKSILPILRRLRHFELHMKSKSDYFGKELVQACPPSLERLYLSDRIIHPYDLMAMIWNLFMLADTPDPRFKPVPDIYDHLQASLDPYCKSLFPVREGGRNPGLPDNKAPWPISLDPSSYEHEDVDIEDNSVRTKDLDSIVWRTPEQGKLEYLTGHVGEDFSRRDYIPLRNGNLRFVHYEFDHSNLPLVNGSHRTPFCMLLYINGRLVDRARNKHLANVVPGLHIPPKIDDATIHEKAEIEEVATRSSHVEYSVLLHSLYEIENLRPRKLADALEELDSSPLTDDERYFGHEMQAQYVFDHEPVAKHEDLEPLTYVVQKDVHVDGKCHWSCPEAEMPNMSEREQAWKERALILEAQQLMLKDQK